MTRVQRRRSPRYSFEAVEWVAPVKGATFPSLGDFVPIRCRDISKSGFSFWLDTPPDFQELIVRIQKGTNAVFVKAEVIHVTRHTASDSHKFLVGCRFTERLSVNSKSLLTPPY
ncbi:MAG: PilZ domain-containing protein [Thermogutta sp.]